MLAGDQRRTALYALKQTASEAMASVSGRRAMRWGAAYDLGRDFTRRQGYKPLS